MTWSPKKCYIPLERWMRTTVRRYLPLTLLLALLAVSFLEDHRRRWAARPLPSPLVAMATGREFQWQFTYPGPDAALGTDDDVHSEKVLYLPPKHEVLLSLQSEDYIYTLTLPEHNLKEIAVPSLTFTMRFRTSSNATLDLLVDPLCSFRFYHDKLMGQIIVQDKDDFSRLYGSSQ